MPNTSKRLYIIGIIVILIIGVVIGRSIFNNRQGSSIPRTAGQESALASPLASKEINQSFTFPVKKNNEEIGNITYSVESAELTKEIVIKGQKGTAVPGRAFLIANLKIKNETNQSVKLNSKDYIRLTVEGEEEQRAPDIHNDPVEVQAISTKYTRVAFPVDDDKRNFTIRIGEISGEKKIIDLKL